MFRWIWRYILHALVMLYTKLISWEHIYIYEWDNSGNIYKYIYIYWIKCVCCDGINNIGTCIGNGDVDLMGDAYTYFWSSGCN